jgi:aspartate/methionine/tyrosine aminotransferase
VTNGSQEALACAILATVDPGDEVLVPDPGFLAYPTLVELAGGVPVPYPLQREAGFAFDADAFRAAITPRTRAAILNSPSNPTGAVLSAADLAAVAAACTPAGIQVVSDEIYRDLYYTPEPPPSAADHVPGAIVVSGLSKSLGMTGWRLGWALGPADAVAAITRLHQFLTTSASAVSQRAALAGFGPAAEAAIAGFRRLLRERRDALGALVEAELGLPYVAPAGAFYLFVQVARYGPSFAVAERLLEHGVITVPGAAFGAQGEGYLRLSFAADVATLRAGVARIRRALA